MIILAIYLFSFRQPLSSSESVVLWWLWSVSSQRKSHEVNLEDWHGVPSMKPPLLLVPLVNIMTTRRLKMELSLAMKLWNSLRKMVRSLSCLFVCFCSLLRTTGSMAEWFRVLKNNVILSLFQQQNNGILCWPVLITPILQYMYIKVRTLHTSPLVNS